MQVYGAALGRCTTRRTILPHEPSERHRRRWHAQYDGLVQDRIAHVPYNSTTTLVTNGLMLLVVIVLFIVHWRWLRRIERSSVTQAA